MEESHRAAIDARTIYLMDTSFPKWTVNEHMWTTHNFSDTVVFYHKEDSLETVKKLALEREPCNIGMRRLYDADAMQRRFGWKHGAYDTTSPNIAVYCHATVHTPEKKFFNVHVLNLIGCALDSPRQPDFQRYKTKDDVIGFYRNMWRLALEAVKTLKKSKFQLYNVGGGAFAGKYGNNFTIEIFEPAFLPLVPEFEVAGIQILGYNFEQKRFNGGFIPGCLNEPTQDLENTVYVNAWDPWSLIGNGNEMDNSLDGWWGRCSNMAVLGWYKTNALMQFIGV